MEYIWISIFWVLLRKQCTIAEISCFNQKWLIMGMFMLLIRDHVRHSYVTIIAAAMCIPNFYHVTVENLCKNTYILLIFLMWFIANRGECWHSSSPGVSQIIFITGRIEVFCWSRQRSLPPLNNRCSCISAIARH